MWNALERIMPDIRQRVEVNLTGTPLTHERFLRRNRGTYGPAISAQEGLFSWPSKHPFAGCSAQEIPPSPALAYRQ